MDDLVKRLREVESNHSGWGYAGIAADRIEELEAKLAKAVDENKLLRDAVYIDDLTVTMQANDKLTALTGIGRALGFLDADMPVEAKTALRTTLAELTGGKNE